MDCIEGANRRRRFDLSYNQSVASNAARKFDQIRLFAISEVCVSCEMKACVRVSMEWLVLLLVAILAATKVVSAEESFEDT